MTPEQARQEAERRVDEFIQLYPHPIEDYQDRDKAIQCALISINREIELLSIIKWKIAYSEKECIDDKLNDLNQIKEELLKM